MNDDVGVFELLYLEAEPRKVEMVAGREGRGIAFLDCPELSSIAEANGEERLFDDHSGIEAMFC